MHPGYHSTRWALEQEIEPKVAVQHHHAHISAVLGEKNINGRVIGVALDGTGYGDDGNVHKRVSMQFGDVEGSFEDADLVLEDSYFFEGNTHLPMEQHASLATPEPDGRLTIHSSTQTPHYLHRALAKVLQMPPARIRVVACPNGGGFGGKAEVNPLEICGALLSRKTGKPVKMRYSREEMIRHGRGRHRPDEKDIGAHGDQPAGQRRLQHVAGQPGILADQYFTVGSVAQHPTGGPTQLEYELRGNRGAADPATNAVGSKMLATQGTAPKRIWL